MLSKKLKRWSVLCLALFALINVGLVAVAPKVFADTMDEYREKTGYYDTDKIRGQVLDHQLYYFLVSCFYKVNMDKTPADEVKNWQWLEKTGPSATAARGGMYDNIFGDCNNTTFVGEAFETLGFKDPVEAFCSLSFTYNKQTGGNGKSVNGGNSTANCITGVEAGKDSDGADGNDWEKTQTNALENLLQTTEQGKTAKGSLSQTAEYIRYLETLVNGCGIGLSQKITASTSIASTSYKIPIVTQDGTVDYWEGQSLGKNDIYGAPMGGKNYSAVLVATRGATPQTKTCGDLEKALPAYAAAYSKYCQTSCKEDTSSQNSGISTSGTEDDECLEGVGNINPLSWMGCAVLNVLDDVLSWLDGKVHQLLFVEQSVPDGIKQSWAVFRNLAYIVLIPAMLLMVIGTAINIGPFDPYTVKKALPRMMVAVIFIALSFPICTFLINVSNLVGNGAGNLITSFAPHGQVTLDGINGAGGTTGAVITAGVLYGLAGGITWGIVGSLGLVMAVALGIGFFILVLRQILIVVLIILAPLAIIVWIFPGNDKLWGIWRTTFIAMLMMYPLISLLIASGQFFAATVSGGGIDGGVSGTSKLIAMVAYIAPFFLIPATFKAGLGVFGNLAGMINDRGRGLFDKQSKYRQAKRAQGWQDFKSGSGKGVMRQTGFVRGAGKRVTGGIRGTVGPNARTIREARWDSAAGAAAADYMKSPEFQAQSENDNLLRAAASGTTQAEARRNMYDTFYASKVAAIADPTKRAEAEAEARAEVENYVAAADKTLGLGRKQQVAAAEQLVNTGTGYDDVEQMSKTLAIASGGSEETASRLAGYANFAAKQKGRHDLAPGFGNLDSLVKDQMKGNAINSTVIDNNIEAGWNSASVSQIAQGKPTATKQFAAHWVRKHERALRTGDAAGLQESAIALKEMKAMLPYASGDNQKILTETIDQMEATRENHIDDIVKASSGPAYVARGAMGPKTKAQADAEASLAMEFGQIDAIADRKARAYERPDPNRPNPGP